MRRLAVRGLGLLLLGALVCPVRAHAGDPEPNALDRWAAEATVRGEPTTWDALLGEPAPVQDNGVPPLIPAMWAVEGRLSRFRGDPSPRWQEGGAALARAFVEGEPAYYRVLREAGKATHFQPRVHAASLGNLVPDDAYALRLARQAMDCLAAIGGEETIEALLWLLGTQGKWTPRSWAEGRQWDAGLRDVLGVIARVAACPRIALLASAPTEEMDASLARFERTVLASVRTRLLARQLATVEMARDLLSGRDVIRESAERLERLRVQLDEIWAGSKSGDKPPILPKVPLPGADIPDYLHDHEALLRDTTTSLELYALALRDAGNIPSMRVAGEAGPTTRAGLAAGMLYGEFAYLLDLVGQIRLARIALLLIGLRAAGPPGADAVRALLAREELWDPLSGLPFEARVEEGKLVVVRAAVPPRTTAPDAPALLTVVYPEAVKAPPR